MEKFQVDPKTDITREPYQGSGPVVASAGYMYISHGMAMLASALGMGTAGYYAHARVEKVEQAFQAFAARHGESGNILMRGTAKLAEFLPKLATKIVESLPGAERMLTNPKVKARASSVIFAGGLGAASAWIGSTVWGVLKGSHEGNLGKRQFERAVTEIKHLRETNDDLEKINDELHRRYVEASTQRTDAKDVRGEESAPAKTEAADTPIAQQLRADALQHEGTLAAPERSATVA